MSSGRGMRPRMSCASLAAEKKRSNRGSKRELVASKTLARCGWLRRRLSARDGACLGENHRIPECSDEGAGSLVVSEGEADGFDVISSLAVSGLVVRSGTKMREPVAVITERMELLAGHRNDDDHGGVADVAGLVVLCRVRISEYTVFTDDALVD